MTEEALLQAISALANPRVIQIVTAVSLVTMVTSLAVTPVILAQLPEDYFLHERPHLLELLRQGPLSKCLIIVAKNILGTILVLVGIILLFMPGQGILTILVGILMLDFPRKHEVMRRIAARPKVARSLNWLRARRGKPPLIL